MASEHTIRTIRELLETDLRGAVRMQLEDAEGVARVLGYDDREGCEITIEIRARVRDHLSGHTTELPPVYNCGELVDGRWT